jgi:cytochrome bd ubiquinol oxidase subunit II
LLWVAVGITLVSVATPLASATVRDRWFDFPRTFAVMLLPLACAAAWFWIWRLAGQLKRGEKIREWTPFAGAVTIYVLAFAGLAYSLFPYVVIDRITIWEAAAHPSSLMVVLIGALIVLPAIIGYTIFSYRVFRGKAPADLYD